MNQIANLIDNKRKHMEKPLSAAQRDKLLLNEAKEDSAFRKNLADATREATASFSNAIKDVSSCMKHLGDGLSRSMEMMAQTVMGQAMANSQAKPMPFNQNLFYQGPPTAYSSFVQYPSHGMQSSATYPNPTEQNTGISFNSKSCHEDNPYHPL